MKRILLALCALAMALPALAQFDPRTTGTRTQTYLVFREAPELPQVSTANQAVMVYDPACDCIKVSQNGGSWWSLEPGGASGGSGVTSIFGRSGAVLAQSGDYLASQISATPFLTITGTTVQSQLQQINARISSAGAVSSVFGRTGAVTATAGDYTATQITSSASGDVSAVTVQAAITELASEKLNATTTSTVTGFKTFSSSSGLRLQPASAPAANTKLFDLRNAAGTSLAWIDAEADASFASATITSATAANILPTLTLAEHASGQAALTKMLQVKNQAGSNVASIDVDGNILAAGITATSVGGIATLRDSTNASTGVGGQLLLAGKSDSFGNYTDFVSIRAGKESFADGNTAGYLSIRTRPDGGSLTEAIRVSSAGDVTARFDLAVTGDTTVGNLTVTGTCTGCGSGGGGTGDALLDDALGVYRFAQYAAGGSHTGWAAAPVVGSSSPTVGADEGGYYSNVQPSGGVNQRSMAHDDTATQYQSGGVFSVKAKHITSGRYWIGLGTPAATNDINYIAAPTAHDILSFRYYPDAGDTNWQACSATAGGAFSCTDTGVPFVLGEARVFTLDFRSTASPKFYIDGALVATRTTNLPSSSVTYRVWVLAGNTASNTSQFRYYWMKAWI